ncbi:DegT/DnrJ/EryC1/StrS family aminotransferase [bacterium]|jgi:CDP-6-deoxy-D-xylo-4-hexulose-3-dehydrase|nr:DegT/DnrJ/EryC1/StrS family aminotransferase [bacterium]
MSLKKLNIPLVKDTIDFGDIKQLISWLETNPRLTKGDRTLEFEKKWSKWLGVKYSIFVNSGSSANLAMIYSLLLSGRLKNKKIVVPSLSWVTSVSPLINFNLEPILCDSDKENLSIDINNLEQIFIKDNPAALMLIHPLGFPNDMNPIIDLCNKYDVIILEDSCETMGSKYNNKLMGSFGLMSTFSFYFGHHISTIEGGMICTDDVDLYKIILSIRSHGWDRDLPKDEQEYLRKKYNIDDFRALYTFYHPGFNLRSTDLQAYIGISQMDKLEDIGIKRENNLKLYDKYIKNDYWKIKLLDNCFISNFAYPIIHPKVIEIHNTLKEYNVETRPLICGSMGKQPFWIERYGETNLPFVDIIHKEGMYLPNNPTMTEDEIKSICDIVNKIIN